MFAELLMRRDEGLCLRSVAAIIHLSQLINCPMHLPISGDLWRLEDDMEGEDEPARGGSAEARPRSHSPFSHFRARAAYLRKSVSADDHLDFDSDLSSGAAAQAKLGHGTKGKLKRKFVSLCLQFCLFSFLFFRG